MGMLVLGGIFNFTVKRVRLWAENGGIFWYIDFWAKNAGKKSKNDEKNAPFEEK